MVHIVFEMLLGLFEVLLEAFIEVLRNAIANRRRRKAKYPLDTPRPTNARNDPASERLFQKFAEKNPVFRGLAYQKNLQRLIQRNREFEDARK